MIKKFLGILTGLFLIVGMSAAQDVTSEPLAYINYLEGSGGRIVSQDSLEEAEINMLILQGDELRSQYCWMEIWTRAGYIRLDHNAVVEFTILEEESVMLTIWRGNIYIRAKNRIGIKTFNKSFNLEPGLYRIEVTDKTKVYKNPMIIDDFDRWNEKREKEIRRSTDQRYLPEELNDYEYALYNYGSWRYDPIYGYVWIPRVSDTWRPYFYGRWVWYPIIGWTWVSYEPFGWCVFHYGRWQWHNSWGWYWIPTRIWGPAWVHWYSRNDYHYWYPMWHDNDYYQRHRDYYDHNGKALNVIHKDQLQSRNVSRHIISKDKLTKNPVTLNRSSVVNSVVKRDQVQSVKSRNIVKRNPVYSNPATNSTYKSSSTSTITSRKKVIIPETKKIYPRNYSGNHSYSIKPYPIKPSTINKSVSQRYPSFRFSPNRFSSNKQVIRRSIKRK